jgi:hypothetical protein
MWPCTGNLGRDTAVKPSGSTGRLLWTWKIDSQIVFISLSDWLHNWIGLSGLLLLISDLFAIPVSVLWVGLEKNM